MHTYWETIHTEDCEGFNITLSFAPETDIPRDHFDGGCEQDEETFRKIENGTYLWFVARVEASKGGVILGTDYLGGCCYSSAEEFMAQDGYFPDMVQSAIAEAKKTIIAIAA